MTRKIIRPKIDVGQDSDQGTEIMQTIILSNELKLLEDPFNSAFEPVQKKF
jgi:hypothetical protein